MKIILAHEIGYCLGVRRAMRMAFKALSHAEGKVYSHGPLIHNQAAMDLLQSKGLNIYEPNITQLNKGDTLIVRAHGLPPVEWAKLGALDIKLIDATCPRVAQIQSLVAKKAKEGYLVIIWGTPRHPEVEGLLGFGDTRAVVVSTVEDILALEEQDGEEKVLLVSQTTQDMRAFEAIKEAAVKRFATRLTIKDTICEATLKRQDEIALLAAKADALVVVGGKDSGNTKRLYQRGLEEGLKTILVDGPEDIPEAFTQGVTTVAIGAGASSPIWQIRKVSQKLRALDRLGQSSPMGFIHRLLRALVLSRVYIALGTGSWGYAINLAMGVDSPKLFFGLFFYFGHAMHILNGYLDRDSARYNDPDFASFFNKYRVYMILAGFLSLFLSLSAAWLIDTKVFFLAVILLALGILYALPLPFGFLAKRGIRRLKDLPLVKPVAISTGWSLLVTIPLYLHKPRLINLDTHGLMLLIIGFCLSFAQIFVRSFLMEMQDARGDRIFSSNTLFARIGINRSTWFLIGFIVLWAIALVTSYFLAGTSAIFLCLILTGPVYNGLVLKRFFLNPWLGGFEFDLLLDTQFILAGLIALLWTYL